jgi:predicted RNase H-like nuclease (RuvC/YqgF family)
MLFMSAREIKCERDRLQRRVHELESEVVRLKNSLAASHKQAVDAVKEKKEAEHTAATATRNLKNATSQINQLEAAAAEAAKREINMKQVRAGSVQKGAAHDCCTASTAA